jgi:arabinofuranosyltransferase
MDHRIAFPVALAAIFLIMSLGCIYYWYYTVEDAYISFRYAENFSRGRGLVYNEGEYVEGYTNFLWVFLLGALRYWFEFPELAKKLGFLFALSTLIPFCMWRRNSKEDRWIGITAASFLVVCPGFHLWSVAGLETSLFTCLLTVAVWLDFGCAKSHPFASGLCFGLATVTRPEGALFFLLFLAPQVIRNIKTPRKIFPYISGYVLIVIPHLLFRLFYYGEWVPNTYWVKGKRFQGGGWAYITRYVAMTGFVGFPIAIMGLGLTKLYSRIISLVLPMIGYILYVLHIGGDWMPMGRFLIPVLPFMALAAAEVLHHLSGRLRKICIVFAVVMSAVIALTSLKYDLLRQCPSHYLDILDWEIPHYDDWEKVGRWFRENSDPDDSMSTGLGGIIPYYSQLKNIDRGGLNDKEIAKIVYNADTHQQEQQMIDRLILERYPTYILDESSSFVMLRESPDPIPMDPNWTLGSNKMFLLLYQTRTVMIDGKYFTFYHRTR